MGGSGELSVHLTKQCCFIKPRFPVDGKWDICLHIYTIRKLYGILKQNAAYNMSYGATVGAIAANSNLN